MNNPMTGTDPTGYKGAGYAKVVYGQRPVHGQRGLRVQADLRRAGQRFSQVVQLWWGAPFAGGPAKSGGGPIGRNVDLSGTTDHIFIVDDVLNNGAYREQILSTLGR